MPANSTNSTPRLNVTDPINRLLVEYLTVDGKLDEEAYIVASAMHNYISIYRIGSSGSNLDKFVKSNVKEEYNIFDSAMVTPIFGFVGNQFWARYASEIQASLRIELMNSLISRMLLANGRTEGAACSVVYSFMPLITVVYCCNQSIDRAVEFGNAFRTVLIESSYHGARS